MENTKALLSESRTILHDRILWFDGSSTVSCSLVEQLLTLGQPITNLYVDSISEEIEKFNRYVPKDQQITIKTSVDLLSFDWNIPEEYQSFDIKEYLFDKLSTLVELQQLTDQQIYQRYQRVRQELKLFEQYNVFTILRVLIYIINTLQAHKIVWGVGRGSSVASYVLYLIGVHDVDSIQYDLDIHDFLHE